VPGGNWHYTDEAPADVPIPNADLLVADFEPSLPPKGVQLPYEEHYHGGESISVRRDHRGPKPIWNSLTSNVPAVRFILLFEVDAVLMTLSANYTGSECSLFHLIIKFSYYFSIQNSLGREELHGVSAKFFDVTFSMLTLKLCSSSSPETSEIHSSLRFVPWY
jgi:hypothetical protein